MFPDRDAYFPHSEWSARQPKWNHCSQTHTGHRQKDSHDNTQGR